MIVSTYATTETATRIPSKDAAAVFRYRDPEFIHPELMTAFCQALLGSGRGQGFDRLLNRRKAGPPPQPANLIPACVGYFLTEHGDLPKGKVAYQLLNKHVMSALPDYLAKLPEGGKSTSRSKQLWIDAKKAGEMLNAAVRTIYDPKYTD